MSITSFSQAVETKLWQFTHSFACDYSKPEHKFIRQILFGLLKGRQVQMNTIGRSFNCITRRLFFEEGHSADKNSKQVILSLLFIYK